MKRLVFCDVDEVLVQFARPALATHGIYGLRSWPYALWDKLGITPTEFWAPITAAGGGWWYRLPKTLWCDDLIAGLDMMCPDWRIATKPFDGPACEGRFRWIAENCGADRKWHMSSNKVDLAGPGRLLIDDYEGNVDAWIEAGGDAILVPRPHNRNCDIPETSVLCFILYHIGRLGYGQQVVQRTA